MNADALQPPRPDLHNLLLAARDNPEDAAARLVLADWLEEHGDEADRARAELIRLQSVLEGEGGTRELYDRQEKLIASYRGVWLGPLQEHFEYCRFSRGLVSVQVKPAVLARLEEHPLTRSEAWQWVEGIEFSTARMMPLAAGCSLLAHVSTLHMPFAAKAAELADVVHSPHLRRLRALYLRNARLDDESAAILAAAPSLAGLLVLGLSHNRIGDPGLAALGNAPHLNNLVALNLEKNRFGNQGFTPRGVAALFHGTGLPRVASLNLRSNRVGDEGAEAVASGPLTTHLTELNLFDCKINSPGIKGAGRIALPAPPRQDFALLEPGGEWGGGRPGGILAADSPSRAIPQ